MYNLKFVGLCGSLRQASRNRGLLRCCAAHLPKGITLELADVAALPFYNEDLPKPDAVSTLAEQVRTADALVLACPEYNYSLAPALKNALDWLSREAAPTPLDGKAACIIGAGGSMGTARAQYHLRQVGVYLNLRFLNRPELFANAFGPAFDADGNVVDAALAQQSGEMMQALADWACQLKKA